MDRKDKGFGVVGCTVLFTIAVFLALVLSGCDSGFGRRLESRTNPEKSLRKLVR